MDEPILSDVPRDRVLYPAGTFWWAVVHHRTDDRRIEPVMAAPVGSDTAWTQLGIAEGQLLLDHGWYVVEILAPCVSTDPAVQAKLIELALTEEEA